MRKSVTFMLYGVAAPWLVWLLASPLAFGQEDKASPQQSGAAPGMDSPQGAKKKVKKNGDYKDMKEEPAASEASRPARAPATEKTISPGECPEKPCTTPSDW